jgi:methyl-accepting chemotaxis protein
MSTHRQPLSRRRLVIDKAFQGNFVLVAVLIAVIVCNALLVYGFLFYEPLLYSNFSLEKALGIAVVELAVVVLASVHSLKTSKKLAGPVHGVLRVMRAIESGDLSSRIALRKGEYFGDVLLQINQGLDSLEERVVSIQGTVSEMQELGEGGRYDPELLTELQAKLGELKTRRNPPTGPAGAEPSESWEGAPAELRTVAVSN